MSERYAPFIGFAGVPFTILLESGAAVYRDWSVQTVIVEEHIPGSNLAFHQVMGTPPATLTLTVEFDSRADFMTLRRKIGTMGDLVLLADWTTAVGDARTTKAGIVYERFGNTVLAGIGTPTIEIDAQRPVTVQLTFKRAFDPETGLAVTP